MRIESAAVLLMLACTLTRRQNGRSPSRISPDETYRRPCPLTRRQLGGLRAHHPGCAGNKSATDIWLSSVDGKRAGSSPRTRHPTAIRSGRRTARDRLRILTLRREPDLAHHPTGGEPRQFTTLSTGASQAVWSPDGTSSRLSRRSSPNTPISVPESDGKQGKVPERARGRHGEGAGLHTAALPPLGPLCPGQTAAHLHPVRWRGEPRNLTPGDRDAVPTSSTFSAGTDYAFSPDGKEIAYTATPSRS